jgi:hypothetical protein
MGDHATTIFEANSIYSPDIGGLVPGQTHDQLRNLGDLVLGDSSGLPILNPTLDYVPTIADLMFIVRNDSTSAIAGVFKSASGISLGQGSIFDLHSLANGQAYYFQISYHGDAASGQFETPFGNDIVLRAVAVPEPVSSATFLLGIVAFWCGASRRLAGQPQPLMWTSQQDQYARATSR